MTPATYCKFTETERQLLTDYFLPLHRLCRDTEQAEKAERLVRGDLSAYSPEQVDTITASVIDLHESLTAQASEAYWEATGLPHAGELAQMRSTEAMKMISLLESFTHTGSLRE